MPRTLLTALAVVVLGLGAAAVGEALDFNGLAYFGALLVAMFLVSLTDRERFYGPPGTAR